MNAFRSQGHLLAAKEEVKGGIQKAMSGKPGSQGLNNIDRNSLKKNLAIAIEIVGKCFNPNEANCVQNIGLVHLQPLLNDFKVLYYPYIEILIHIEDSFKKIILSDEP